MNGYLGDFGHIGDLGCVYDIGDSGDCEGSGVFFRDFWLFVRRGREEAANTCTRKLARPACAGELVHRLMYYILTC